MLSVMSRPPGEMASRLTTIIVSAHTLRGRLWLSGYEENQPLVIHVRTLNAARKASQLAVAKGPLLALLTNAGGSASPQWSVASTNYTKGEEVIDVVSCATTKAGANGAVSWTSQAGMPAVRRSRCASVGG